MVVFTDTISRTIQNWPGLALLVNFMGGNEKNIRKINYVYDLFICYCLLLEKNAYVQKTRTTSFYDGCGKMYYKYDSWKII